MASGKRLSTDEPLTEHDIAARIDKAALRLINILMDIRQQEGDLWHDVRRSRYMSGVLGMLGEEIAIWEKRLWEDLDPTASPPRPITRIVSEIEGDGNAE
jgi:hypothetical protein